MLYMNKYLCYGTVYSLTYNLNYTWKSKPEKQHVIIYIFHFHIQKLLQMVEQT